MSLKQIDIHECHKQLLDIAVAFDQICRTHQIPYYMLGGTMLGAIRHKGFIPWDDDMDFGIPRPYFQQFIEIAQRELPTFNTLRKPAIRKGFIKIELKGSKLIEKNFDRQDTSFYTGIAIDVFPLDGANNSSIEGRIYIKLAFNLLRLQEGRLCSLNIRKGFKKIIAFMIKKAPINDDVLIAFIDRWIQRFNYEESTSIVNFYGNWKEKELMNKRIFSKPILYPFEKCQFYGVSLYDDYLKQLYGDYMQLPSVEKRTCHADEIYIVE